MTTQDTDRELPFLSHLLELRDRILRMLLAIAVVFLVLMPFANAIYTFTAQPLLQNMPAGTTMIATQVASPFLAPFKLTLVVAVFVAMPFLLYQFWAFVAPGLYQHERRLVVPLVVSSVVLFYLGAAFAYFVVFPMVFAFFTATAPEGVAVMTDINSYLDFVLTLFFAFGVAFEVPIATIVLVSIGVVEPDRLKGMRPYVIVGAFVVGMFLTPPDIFSQTFLAVPMWLLFEVGLFMSRFVLKRKKEAEAAREAEAGSAAAVPAVAAAGGHRPMTPEEMEAELDRIEAEDLAARQQDAPAGEPPGDAADAEDEDDEDDEVSDDEGEAEAASKADEPDPDDPFGRRAAAQAKLERVMTLRANGELMKARQLLYEVLVEGSEDQVFVARNILNQLDAPG